MTESHPLGFFLPSDASILLLGSFPPPRRRWSIDFFYPNINNDMWRIFGLVFFDDREHFILPGKKAFDKEMIVSFLSESGIAMGDTASKVVRQKENASDAFLDVCEASDIEAVMLRLPSCRFIAATGKLAFDTLCSRYCVQEAEGIGIGDSIGMTLSGRDVRLFRMPSSSRAYPLPLEVKAGYYRKLFQAAGIGGTRIQ